jgi:hypothetical protein
VELPDEDEDSEINEKATKIPQTFFSHYRQGFSLLQGLTMD